MQSQIKHIVVKSCHYDKDLLMTMTMTKYVLL
jgi:hypothetical protein